MEDITKHKYLIKEQKNKINSCLETLERNIFDIELNSKSTFNEIFAITKSFQSNKTIIQPLLIIHDFIEKIDHKHKKNFMKLIQIFSNLNYIAHQNDHNELLFMKNDILIAFTKTYKSKLELILPIHDTNISININYEKIKHKESIINIIDDVQLWEYILQKISL